MPAIDEMLTTFRHGTSVPAALACLTATLITGWAARRIRNGALRWGDRADQGAVQGMGRYNVTVNAVAFGLIRTRLTEVPAGGDGKIDIAGRQVAVGVNPELLDAMERGIPLGRAGTPADAAGAVYLLPIPESDYVSGQVVICGGGFTA